MKNEFDYCSEKRMDTFIRNGLSSIAIDKMDSKYSHNLGFIYLIDFGDSKTKIGLTKNDPRERLKQLNHTGTIMPFDLEIIALGLCEEVKCVERMLHTRYNNLRCVGEWFDFSNKKYKAFKLELIEDLSYYSLSFCFCNGWIKWKPEDSFIENYAKCPIRDDIKEIIYFEKNKEKCEEELKKWIDSIKLN